MTAEKVRLKSGEMVLNTAENALKCSNRDKDGKSLDQYTETIEVVNRWIRYMTSSEYMKLDEGYAKRAKELEKIKKKTKEKKEPIKKKLFSKKKKKGKYVELEAEK